jgi:hypothetical protein
MQSLDLSLSLPNELFQELIDAAVESRVSPKIFCEQTVECALASRRLPRATPGRNGARVGVFEEEPEVEGYPVHADVEHI